MASFVYFYSKFTDEFLLLTASAMFGLLGYYCYHWAINRRRLGSSPRQVPAGVVKEYLNQLINEAQFIRTQLFGILSGMNENSDPAEIEALFNNMMDGQGQAAHAGATFAEPAIQTEGNSAVSPDLLNRLKALEAQLAEKEGMIVNVNVEKNKLLQDLDAFKKSQKAGAAAAQNNNNDELLKRLKMLEQQLEEYNMFEDDLANIKRIQQENEQLKRKIEEVTAYSNATGPKISEPVADNVSGKDAIKAPSLDQASIDALLEGISPVPPGQDMSVPDAPEMATNMEDAITASLAAEANAVASQPAMSLVSPLTEDPVTSTADVFENIANSVDTSLDSAAPAMEAASPAPMASVQDIPQPKSEAKAAELSKSDEELLKEFENLLNSG